MNVWEDRRFGGWTEGKEGEALQVLEINGFQVREDSPGSGFDDNCRTDVWDRQHS